ncbi:MAG: 16S rRNA (cytosine(967)-C(5))-methyltransferase RsmB [Desulfopila sp.]|jgi:16S rRNA (cytosine967-C5)-methyltransferase|nr:16S rRNA (cytosine(967)-C(5))-methyltransferase RsmB [Desulfopila sp.]
MTCKNTSRLVAIETLHLLQRDNTPLPLLLEHISNQHNLSDIDRSFAMNLTYGVLRHYQYLELLMTQLCKPSLKKLHPLVLQGLAVGLYQIFFLDRVPNSAAVNETVSAIKKAKVPQRLHGFVNGVLRQSIRQMHELPPPGTLQHNGQLILNHPDWLTTRWSRFFGVKEMESICAANSIRQPLTLRINTTKIPRQDYNALLEEKDIKAIPGNFAPNALLLPDFSGSIPTLPGYQEGLFQIQGEAAQLATLLLSPWKKKGYYLDGCAGLGGKTGHLLELLSPSEAHLCAVEPEIHRQKKLLDNLTPFHHLENFSLFKGNLQQFHSQSRQLFDGILIDAPCSGTGITGRHPDIRWRRSLEDIKRYSEVQYELLQIAAKMVAPGGVLVYATCSLEQEENRDTVVSFLQSHNDFRITDCTPYLPESAAPLIRNGCFQPLPSQGIDGFFAARLVASNTNAY